MAVKRCALLLALLHGLLSAQTPTGAELARSIRSAGLDPQQCFHVRDLAFSRDEIKFFFNDGFLLFTNPVNGERLSALFTGSEDAADGELLLLPPTRDERQSLAKFTRTPNLDEHFRTALLTFTDATARELMQEIAAGRGRPGGEDCAGLAMQWDPLVQNLNESLVQRVTGDLLAPQRPGGGFLFASLQSDRLGAFDVMFDPLGDDQILAGQFSERGGLYGYDVWTSFPSRARRNGSASRYVPPMTVTNYRITAALDDALHLKATTHATVKVGSVPGRVFNFAISRAEEITAARLDGVPVEVLFRESSRSRALRADENDLFLVIAPQQLEPGSTHELELEHDGQVIIDQGSGVYSVSARSNWYPRISLEFATYDLEFRYPSDLTLVSVGDVIEEHTEGNVHVTHRRTPGPIRVAGFNLGHYARTSATVDGLTVDVYGNRGLDPALTPRPRATLLPPTVRARGAATPVPAQPTTVIQTPPAPDPLGRMDAVAADVSQSLQFYASAFGPPPLKTLTVSPIPGTTGQGFPGLIYLSTLSYLDETQRPDTARDARTKTFFSDLMVAHEVAHQWWGNIVGTGSYQDDWIMEGLAHYSALLYLEKKRGSAYLNNELTGFREDLLQSSPDGGTIESYGPLSWGYRLESARYTDTWRVITYEKGAWIFHMLRARLGDQKFLALLSELRKKFEYRDVTTADLRALVKQVAGSSMRAESADAFFDSWVQSTGVPDVQIKFSTTGRAPSVRVTGAITYEHSSERGVASTFATEMPLEITFGNGTKRVEWIRSADGTEPFSLTFPSAPSKISLLPNATLATQR